MLSSRTITSLLIESTSARPVFTSTLVTSANQREDNDGVRNGTGMISDGPAFDGGDSAQHLNVFQHLGSTDIEDASNRLWYFEHTDEVTNNVRGRNGLSLGVYPTRSDHRRQMLDELAGYLPGNPAVTDDDSSPKHRNGDIRPAQQAFDLAATAQMRREVIGTVTQAAEVDDTAHSGSCGSLAERRGSVRIGPGEVALAQAMHEVIRSGAATHRLGKRHQIGYVSLNGFAYAVIVLRPASHRDHVMTGCLQRWAKLAPHKPR